MKAYEKLWTSKIQFPSFTFYLLPFTFNFRMKIIVRGTNWIGDAVMQIPALRELRRVFPQAHITLCTRAWAQGIFQDVDFIDDILTIESDETILQQAKKWRKGKFDLAI